jgi:hypothetical protein
MGELRKRPSHDKDSMKKSLEPYFARAFSLRSEVAAAKTAKEAAIAALAQAHGGAELPEGVPPQPLTLSPRSPKPDDPGYQAFVAARQALKGTLEKPTPT